MPSFSDWLRGSWDDFRRRWLVILAVVGTAGAAALAGCFLPFLPAAAASLFGVGPAWAVWGAAGAVALSAVLWLSAWAQAALARAARRDEAAGACLAASWRQTAGFAWVLTILLVAVAGGYILLVLPGILLSVFFCAAPFYQISGEASGIRALGLSWARVYPSFWTVAARVLAAGLIAAAPGWIPYVGWIITMFWAPFGAVALARLAEDLRRAAPDAEPPVWTAAAVSALALVLVLSVGAAGWSAVSLARRVAASPEGLQAALARGLDPETGQALIAVLSGSATPEQRRKAADFAIEASSTALAGAAP